MAQAQNHAQNDAQDYQRPELVCPAGTPAALRTAVDAGADTVYCGLQNETNARNFPGLNFTVPEVEQSLAYAHVRKAKVLLAINTFPPAGKFRLWRDAIDAAARLGVDAVIVADMGVADYAARLYPDLRLHLSVQAGASSPEAIRFYCEEFGIKRVVLPRMLTVAEIAELHRQIPCEIEAFVFGNIGMMAEGRCSLTNYVTGASTNMDGICSPAADVHYEEDAERNLTTRLGEYVVDCFASGESAGYTTICKGRYLCGAQSGGYYAFEEPVSLNLSALFEPYLEAVATRLAAAGKTVVFSTLAEVMSKQERRLVESFCADSTAMMEANDGSALLQLRGRPHHVGPFVNVYNERTLAVLARGGACNICLPSEMPAAAIAAICVDAAKLGVAIEAQVFGRLSLALSARCYHARAHGRTKDTCQFICENDPDGMPLRTLEDKPFLTVNGIQTMSHDYLNLIGELADLEAMGVRRFRLSPHSCDMVEVAATFRAVLDRRIDTPDAAARLDALKIEAPFSNGFYYGKPGHSWNRAMGAGRDLAAKV